MTAKATIGPFTKHTEREIGERLQKAVGDLFPDEPVVAVVVEQIAEPDDDPGGKPW